jgi:uncharacterized protein|tara:strand:- start:47217 stop:48461 length:1245 start_codon:yes stop_codon:yes gene_type:complete
VTLAGGPLAAPADRIATLDIIRGIAICGILFINIWVMGSVSGVEYDARLSGWGILDQAVWWLQMVFVEGTMRGLLSLLFGAGFVLMSARAGAGRYFRRTLILILLGAAHAWLLLWPGDILFVYGIAGLLLYFVKDVDARPLVGAGIAILVFLAGLGLGGTAEVANMRALAEGAAAAGAQADDARIVEWADYRASLKPSAAKMERSLEARAGSFAENWHYKLGVSNDWMKPESLVTLVLDALAMMLIGAGLMKYGLLSGEADADLYRWMLVAGYGFGIPISLAEWGQLYAANFAHPNPILFYSDEIGRVAMTMGHLGLLLWLWRRGTGRRALGIFAPVGRLALTNYISQTLICQGVLFPGFGLGLHARLSLSQLWGVALLILLAQIAASHLWLRYFRFGPLEWLWRWGTYLRRPA